MTEYNGVRYQAIDPSEFGKDSRGNPVPVAKLLYSLTNETGAIDYPKLDKLATGRRITEVDSDDWFLRTFQCQSAPLGQQIYTTIGELTESLANEHFSQFPVVIQRVKEILGEKDTGLLQTWVLSQDIEVGFVVTGVRDVEKFISGDTLHVAKAKGIIVSGRHRLSSILTLLEHGLHLPYSRYKNFKIRVTGKTFPSAEKMAHYVRLANTTRRMSTPEKANIVQQVKYGAGTTSDIDKQLALITAEKGQDATKKAAFANIFRILTEGDTYKGAPVTDITRYNVGIKLFTALFNYYKDDDGEKHIGRINLKSSDYAVVSQVLRVASDSYKKGFEGLTNIARDGVDSGVDAAVKGVCSFFKIKSKTPLYDEGVAPATVTVTEFEPLVNSKVSVDNYETASYTEQTETETEALPVETVMAKDTQSIAESATPKRRAVVAKRRAL